MIKLEVETTDFTKNLRQYAATVKKDGDDIVNTAAFYVANQAIAETRHADRADIEALRQVSSVAIASVTKTGKYRKLKDFTSLSKSQRERRTTYEATPTAFMYYLYWLRATRRDPSDFASRQALMSAALNMVNARISSIHYLRSGWIEARNRLEQASKSIIAKFGGKIRIPERKKRGQGGAVVSANGRNTALIWNSSLWSKWEKRVAPSLVKYGTEGLQRALVVSGNKLKEIAEERLAKAARRAKLS